MEGVTAGPSHPGAPLPQPLRRARTGRWLGGVCRGMANRWNTPVAQLRALFVVAALFGGLGLLAYAACWLVLPTDAEEDSPSLLRGVASVAMLAAALAGLATLAALAAAATLFGFGWAVVVALGAFLLGALVVLPAVSPAWILPPLVAIALPAVVVAASGVRLHPQAGVQAPAPRTVGEIPAGGYTSGLSDLLVDLRGLRAARDTVVPIKLDTGLGRTVVALPDERCFNVEVTYATAPGWQPMRDLVQSARTQTRTVGSQPLAVFYGEVQSGGAGRFTRRSDDPRAPTLRIESTSVGGELWVRDYPIGVGPLFQPDWPYAYYGLQNDENDPAVARQLREQMRGVCAPGARARARREAARQARERVRRADRARRGASAEPRAAEPTTVTPDPGAGATP